MRFSTCRWAAMRPSRAQSLLGVTAGASSAELKQAFRLKALEWHPDRNPSPDARKRFAEVRAAFEMLAPHAGPSRRPGCEASTGSEAADSMHTAAWPWWYDWADDENTRRGFTAEDVEVWSSFAEEVMSTEAHEQQGLRRGVLLVASPNIQDLFYQTVVLMLETGIAGCRGVVLNSSDGRGGPLSCGEAPGDFEATLFHSCTELASTLDKPVADGMGLFAEERLTRHAAAEMEAKLLRQSLPLAVLPGYAGWRPHQLENEVVRGEWQLRSWGSLSAHWWLNKGRHLPSHVLWQRAYERLKPPHA